MGPGAPRMLPLWLTLHSMMQGPGIARVEVVNNGNAKTANKEARAVADRN